MEDRAKRQQSSSSRGRSSSRNQHATSASAPLGDGAAARQRPNSHSNSSTPRRKGNPQSSSRSPSQEAERGPQRPASGDGNGGIGSPSAGNQRQRRGDDLTPLSALSTILTARATSAQTALQLYHQSHALHRHASERSSAALEKLREAQAEVEHAATAQEFAREELDRAASLKSEAQAELDDACRGARRLGSGLSGRRVRLVGLSKNATWNGRTGTIVKLVTDAGSQDVGRWKVRLDSDWRGKDAEGRREGGSASGEDDDGEGGDADGNVNVVVAKAENLELVEDEEGGFVHFFGGGGARRSASRSRSASGSRLPPVKKEPQEEQLPQTASFHQSRQRGPGIDVRNGANGGSPYRRSRDPSISRRNCDPDPEQPAAVVTPDSRRGVGGASYGNSVVAAGRHRASASPSKRSHQSSSSSKFGQSRNGGRNQSSSSSTPQSKKYSTPIRRSASTDSERLSNAFSQMMTSPVSFTPVSFCPVPSDSFQRWVEHDGGGGSENDDRAYHQQQRRQRYGHNANNSGGDMTSIAGSFFDEVTSLEKYDASFPPYGDERGNIVEEEDEDEIIDAYNHEEWDEGGGEQASNDPRNLAPSEGDGLPNIVVLEEDDYDNPFLSPGYESASPPHCVGVQNAGVPHVNGVYLLAYPKDEDGNPIQHGVGCGDNASPPLYFKDGPPTFLPEMDRYYDMCILRINCPDSADHVIWFLARVDVDPDCLDVKFSDCYYYCRMLRNDDGCGGERDGGCVRPPERGWNVPKLPPGVEMLSIARSGSFSTSNTANASTIASPAYNHGHQQ